QMIRRNVELEARLIDDLLDLTRIDRGKVQLNFEIVDADTLLQNALEICQPEIDRKHLRPSLNLSAKRVHMRADPARLQQIFWNLINNAVKFTPPNGQITAETKVRPSRWFFPPVKKRRRRSLRRSCRLSPNASPCGFCWSKIMKTPIAPLRVCFDGGVITCNRHSLANPPSRSARKSNSTCSSATWVYPMGVESI